MQLFQWLKSLVYVKECLSLNGAVIRIYKIRTMQIGADSIEEHISPEDLDSNGKVANDSRVTFLGRILRRYWIDEIPQLLSLLKGDIKLVGLRPTTIHFWKQYPKDIMKRALQQKPGLIGIHYAFPWTPDFDDYLRQTDEYLQSFDKNPYLTDIRYFFKVVYAIIFKGIRSN